MENQPKALDSYEQAAEQRIRGIEPSQDEGMHDQKAVLTAKLETLANNLLKKRDEAVAFRAASGVERRWLEDTKAFDGLDATSGGSNSMLDYASGAALVTPSVPGNRSEGSPEFFRSSRSRRPSACTSATLYASGLELVDCVLSICQTASPWPGKAASRLDCCRFSRRKYSFGATAPASIR